MTQMQTETTKLSRSKLALLKSGEKKSLLSGIVSYLFQVTQQANLKKVLLYTFIYKKDKDR